MNYSSINPCDFAATSGTRSNASHWGYLPACLACACLSTGFAACASENDTESNDNPDSGSVDVERDESQPEVLAAKSYTIRNSSSDLCIGVDRADTAPDTPLKQFVCDGADNQTWLRQNAGVDKDYWRNKNSELCIGVDDGSSEDGANLKQFRCDTRDNQTWTHRDDGSMQNLNSKLCMGVDGGSSEDGAQLKQFGCDGRDNQDWILKAR
jgi:Ricin-type beta-trefoil lectin domain